MIKRIWRGREREGNVADRAKMTWFVQAEEVDGSEVLSKLSSLCEVPERIYLGAGKTWVKSWKHSIFLSSYCKSYGIELVVETDLASYSLIPASVKDIAEIVLTIDTDTDAVEIGHGIKYIKFDNNKSLSMFEVTEDNNHTFDLSDVKDGTYTGTDEIIYEYELEREQQHENMACTD